MKKYAKCRNDNEQQNLVITLHRHITDYRSWEKSILNLIIHKIMNSKGKNPMLSAYLIWNNTPMSSTPASCFNFAIKVISCYMSETCNLKMEKQL